MSIYDPRWWSGYRTICFADLNLPSDNYQRTEQQEWVLHRLFSLVENVRLPIKVADCRQITRIPVYGFTAQGVTKLDLGSVNLVKTQ
ncbi:hypothetical protein CEE69_06855 [Rhodopirellula bahusiensis]|uniref:Uncharacterized protein n=1 Tax=Rhodopirellula bahusiensis TaxID=2014065 RepID=A0A2G1WBA7_9BACT|nr:hypothetical protein CEE69_06855 [Rhodopirellula bahusiensis]